MIESINQEDWDGVYYSVGLGKLFTVDVREDCIYLKNPFSSIVEREFDSDYFIYFVNNSEFINVKESDYSQTYKLYSDLFKNNLRDIEKKILKIRIETLKQKNRCSEIKSKIKEYKMKSRNEFKKQNHTRSLELVEKYKVLEFELKNIEEEIENLQEKKKKYTKLRDTIKKLDSK